MAEGRVECLATNGNYVAITATRNDFVCCHLLFTIFLNAKLRPSAQPTPNPSRTFNGNNSQDCSTSREFLKARGKVMKIYARKVSESLIFFPFAEKQ